MIFALRNLAALAVTVSAVLVAPACDDDQSTSVRFKAFTPEHAGMGLELSDADAALELADGTRLELGLDAEQLDSLADVCDGDERITQVALRPLALGERDLAAPVLEARCAGEAETPQLTLRDSDDACADGECVSFGTPLFGEGGLQLSAPEEDPLAVCAAPGTRTCVTCPGGKMQWKTITSATYNPNTGACTYTISYGPCLTSCAL